MRLLRFGFLVFFFLFSLSHAADISIPPLKRNGVERLLNSNGQSLPSDSNIVPPAATDPLIPGDVQNVIKVATILAASCKNLPHVLQDSCARFFVANGAVISEHILEADEHSKDQVLFGPKLPEFAAKATDSKASVSTNKMPSPSSSDPASFAMDAARQALAGTKKLDEALPLSANSTSAKGNVYTVDAGGGNLSMGSNYAPIFGGGDVNGSRFDNDNNNNNNNNNDNNNNNNNDNSVSVLGSNNTVTVRVINYNFNFNRNMNHNLNRNMNQQQQPTTRVNGTAAEALMADILSTPSAGATNGSSTSEAAFSKRADSTSGKDSSHCSFTRLLGTLTPQERKVFARVLALDSDDEFDEL